VKLRREARTLKLKALASLRRGVSAFNSYEEDARITVVLLHLQHAAEMLLKAILVQKGVGVFDPDNVQASGSGSALTLPVCIVSLLPLKRAYCEHWRQCATLSSIGPSWSLRMFSTSTREDSSL
jgi:hypothetical protein